MKFIEVKQFAAITVPELLVQWVRAKVQREPEEKLMQITDYTLRNTAHRVYKRSSSPLAGDGNRGIRI